MAALPDAPLPDVIELPQLRHAPQLFGIGAHEIAKMVDLEPGQPPVAGVDVAAGLNVLIEHKARERGLGARNLGADVADD